MRRFRLALDTGGTFTDVVAFDQDSGAVHTTKTPTTPADPSIGFMAGIHKIARQAGFGLDRGEVVAVSHGTTVATNALLSGPSSFPGLGLIVTRRFRHLLEIARQSVPQGYGALRSSGEAGSTSSWPGAISARISEDLTPSAATAVVTVDRLALQLCRSGQDSA